MKKNVIPAFLLSVGLLLVLCIAYPLVIWGIAQLSPNQGNGFVLKQGNQYYYQNIGQRFTEDKYFWSRPSAVGYNAAGSGASNIGATNASYLKEIEQRIEDYMKRNPDVRREDIPVDLITASGSGLDPNISIRAAKVQVFRIAKARGIDNAKVYAIIDKNIEYALLGFFGPTKVNVLKVNMALDALK